MDRYHVTLTGETPLLMHNDNLKWADLMEQWKKDPAHKKESKAGDDRTPAWRWIGNLYVDRGAIVVPADNLMTLLREGGQQCPTGNGKQTFKKLTQSGIIVDEASWPLLIGGKGLSWSDIEPLTEEEDYQVHRDTCESLGFELFEKRAKIGQAKHVRVRPRFDNWSVSGTITVLEPRITRDVLSNILSFAGVYAGLCDWRPSSPSKPGSFGKFRAELTSV